LADCLLADQNEMAMRRLTPALSRASGAVATRAPAVTAVPKRYLNIHEYQSSALMAEVV